MSEEDDLNILRKMRRRGGDERFDFKQLEEDRNRAKNNQPSNPYIRQGMGVLSTINDFAPPVAIVKAADTITDQVSKGQYGEAAKTLGWELAMTNPAAKLIGKGVKKLRGIPSSVYGGPLKMTDKAPTFTPEQLSKLEKLRLDQLKGLEDEYDMLIHSSRSKNLDLDTFNFRPSNLPDKAAYGKGPGIFTHGARDADKYNDFGPYKYGVLVRKNRPTYPSKIDSNDPRGEVFVPRDTVEDIFLLE